MKLAVAGKGGAGKTTFCATAARLLARRGYRVVAIDGDTNPNLHAAIGLSDEPAMPPFLPASLISRRFDGPRLSVPVSDVLAEFAAVAPDGVQVMRMGVPEHPDEGCMCSAHATVAAVMAELGADPAILTLLDLEASPEHLSRGTARHADVLALIAEPYFRSLEAVRLQASLASESSIERVCVVANKCRTETDAAAIAEFCAGHGLHLIGQMPWSDSVVDADALGRPLLDHAPVDPVVDSVAAVLDAVGLPEPAGVPS